MSKPIARTTTSATVSVTIELSNIGSWGPDCDLSQVYRQATEAAVGRINQAFRGDSRGIRILGPAKVQAITTDMEKRG